GRESAGMMPSHMARTISPITQTNTAASREKATETPAPWDAGITICVETAVTCSPRLASRRGASSKGPQQARFSHPQLQWYSLGAEHSIADRRTHANLPAPRRPKLPKKDVHTCL